MRSEELRKMEKEGKGKAVPRTETVRWLYMQALCPDKVSLPEQKKVDWILDRVEEQAGLVGAGYVHYVLT